ncbi:hypothetical protein HJC23_012393 [Cyclotella cryptica]|uniref:UVR domain-containing protein n=1 Tax=Cyclotella cryptica TaxID=29204 RepID=A0ABD3NXM5_9STRA|eukprot:CCRYP_019919-RA/>CCRYP_019919-RA protein AED:0.02 eAED:0.02 QI:366/1/1/1/1/1/4/170/1187
MFGGLEIKGSPKDDSSSAAPATTTSAFGFLSSPPADSVNDGHGGTNISGSGFSFLSSSSSLAAQPEDSSRALDGVSTASTAGSSFSFLGGSSAAADGRVDDGSRLDGQEPPAHEAVSEPQAMPASMSGFSFLSSPVGQAENSGGNDDQSDLLSATNHALPAGAGVSWSAPPIPTAGAATKKVIKKKTGKTRVGIATNALPSAPAMPPAALDIPPPTPVPATPAFHAAPGIPPSPGSPPLKVKAERVHHSAEEFIREKQRSAIAMAAERAMLEKTHSHGEAASVSSDGWKLANDDSYAAATLSQPPQASPTDETYRAAKAAAEEARKLESSPALAGNKPKFSLSGFFQRGRSAGSGNGHGGSAAAGAGEIGSYSSHGGVVGRAGTATTTANGVNDAPPGSTLPPTREEDGAENQMQMYHQNQEDQRAMTEEALEEHIQQQQREKDMMLQRERMEQQQRDEAERKKRKAEQERLERERQNREIEAAKRRSPREKMNVILANFASSTKSSTELVSRLRMQREKLIADRLAAEKTQQYAAQQIAFAESLQTKAAEEEDFEAADRLASVIETHTQEQQAHMEICKAIDKKLDQLGKEQEEAVKRVASCFGEVYDKLKGLEVEQEGKRKEDGKDVLDQFAATSKRLSAETERLNTDLKHIERDEELVAEEQKELEGQIADGTKEFEAKCIEANEKLEEVNQRIVDLRRQLMEAESEAATLNSELSTHKACIENIRNKFSRQLGRLEKKQRTVKESRAEWESEQKSLERERTAHEAVMEAHAEDLLSRDKLLEDINSELSVAKRFEGIILQHFGQVGDSGGEEHMTSLDSEVLKCEAAVDEAKQNLQSAEAAIERLQEEVSLIEVRLPVLEAEKKAAATKRDFKAAGKASKEIKDALARKEQCEAQLADEALARKQVAKEELSKATALLDDKKSIAAERDRELGKKQISLVKDKISDLKSILNDLSIAKTESEDAINVACIGALVITSQISALEATGRALGEQYGGWDPTTPSCNDEHKEDTAQTEPNILSTNEATSEKKITEEILEQYTFLRQETVKLEAAVEKAVEDEDFEAAAELDEKLETARAAIKALDFSPDALDNELRVIGDCNKDGTKKGAPELDPTCEPHSDGTESVASSEGAKLSHDVNASRNDDIYDEKKSSEDGVLVHDKSCQSHVDEDSTEIVACHSDEKSN